jgi:glycosyltransferase involved in cell wall biosynthesis
MIRALFVSHTSRLNGAERMLLETLKELDRTKFEPFLVVPGAGPLAEEAEAAGIRTFAVSMKWSLSGKKGLWKQPIARVWNLRSVSRIRRLIKEEGIALVVTNTAACWSGARAAHRAGVPHVWFVHEILGGKDAFLFHILGEGALVRAMARLSVRIIANSKASAAPFAGTGKTVVIGNGIDTRLFDPIDRAAARRSLGVGNAGPVLGVIGIVCPGKGQTEAIRVTGVLKSRFPGVRLLVVGAMIDKRYAGRIRDEVLRLGLDENVLLLGYRTDIPVILAGLDVLVVASSVDSLGRVALEAMAAKTPVVAAARGGVPEIVRDGETGILVDSPDPAAFAAGVAALLGDPEKAKAVAEGGRKLIETAFSLAGQVGKIERALEESVGK